MTQMIGSLSLNVLNVTYASPGKGFLETDPCIDSAEALHKEEISFTRTCPSRRISSSLGYTTENSTKEDPMLAHPSMQMNERVKNSNKRARMGRFILG